jgi:hypothetical protein
MANLPKRSYDGEQLGASKHAKVGTNQESISRRTIKCAVGLTVCSTSSTSLHACHCYERLLKGQVGLRYQRAQVETRLIVGLSPEFMRADDDLTTVTQCPCALHQTLCTRLLEVMCHNDTHSSTAASCSAVLHQFLTTAPGNWQPLQMSSIMQMMHSITGAPARQLVVLADALGIVHQAIRDAARLGVGPVILLTDTVTSAELYREPLAAALDIYFSWGSSVNMLDVSTLSQERAVLYSSKGRACTAALQLAGFIGNILVEQGRLTSVRAAEVFAAAH